MIRIVIEGASLSEIASECRAVADRLSAEKPRMCESWAAVLSALASIGVGTAADVSNAGVNGVRSERLSADTVSRYMSYMRDAGLVSVVAKRGGQHVYQLTAAGLSALSDA